MPQEELSSPAGSDFALGFACLLPGSLCLGGVFAFPAGAEEAATRAHAHVPRRARSGGAGTICSVNAALPLNQAKAALPGKELAGRVAGAARAGIPASLRESSAALEPARGTHAHIHVHTKIHTGTHRAQAPAHVAPGHPA